MEKSQPVKTHVHPVCQWSVYCVVILCNTHQVSGLRVHQRQLHLLVSRSSQPLHGELPERSHPGHLLPVPDRLPGLHLLLTGLTKNAVHQTTARWWKYSSSGSGRRQEEEEEEEEGERGRQVWSIRQENIRERSREELPLYSVYSNYRYR